MFSPERRESADLARQRETRSQPSRGAGPGGVVSPLLSVGVSIGMERECQQNDPGGVVRKKKDLKVD